MYTPIDSVPLDHERKHRIMVYVKIRQWSAQNQLFVNSLTGSQLYHSH